MLFIYGNNDHFVPQTWYTQITAQLGGLKELWAVKGASHASSFAHMPKAYRHHVESFLSKYIR